MLEQLTREIPFVRHSRVRYVAKLFAGSGFSKILPAFIALAESTRNGL